MFFLQTVIGDLRFCIRMLLRRIGFTSVAVFALAVGIGINTAAFTAYKSFFARKLEARDAERMVNLALLEHSGAAETLFSYPDYEAYRDGVRSFDGVIATSLPQYLTLSSHDGVVAHRGPAAGSLIGRLGLLPQASNFESAISLLVSDNYFSVLGAAAERGRTFGPADAPQSLASPSALISENYWWKRYDGDPHIVGKTVLLNGAAVTIIGVTPHNFVGTFIAAPDFWLPLSVEPLIHPASNRLQSRDHVCCRLFARLAPGIRRNEAQAEMSVVANRLRGLHDPHSDLSQPVTAALYPGSPLPVPVDQVPAVRISILFVGVAVGMVLLVACANVAGLQLARTASRRSELAMRMSLGASRSRLVRQLLTESAVLGLIAGVLSLAISWVVLQQMVNLIANAFPDQYGTFVFHVAPDVSVFAFVFLISMAASLIFGLLPALESSRSIVSAALKANAATSPRSGRRLRSLLIATQIAVCSVLLIAGGMLIHSAIRALHMDTGYDDAHVIELSVQFPESASYSDAPKASLIQILRSRLAATPGVTDVTMAHAPDDNELRMAYIAVDGEAPARQSARVSLYYSWVEPNYFRTLGIPMALGREFTAQAGQREASAIVSESAARRLWPGQSPLARTFQLGTDGQFHPATEPLPDGPVWRVIGVSRDTRGVMFDGSDSEQIYLPLPDGYVEQFPILVRTRADVAQVIGALDAVIASVDPNLAVQASTLEQLLRQTAPFISDTLAAAVASTTGILGLLLAAIGIYGTVSYVVVLRTREVGIRMALGARKGKVLALVLGESARPVVGGLSVGIFLAAGVSWLLRHILYGLHVIDGISFVGVSLLLLGIALLAAFVPARRATRVDPVVALRYE
ncbi:MAG TPA: ABC transporter permease [Candidatus Sulfotelmatobacter sp.]|jgi:predicted permease